MKLLAFAGLMLGLASGQAARNPEKVENSPPGGAKGAMWQLVKEDVPDNCKGEIYKPVDDECCGDLENQTKSFDFDNQGQCAVIHLDIRNNGTLIPLFNKKQCDGDIMHYGERCNATDAGECECGSEGDLDIGKCYRGASSQTTDYFLKVDSCVQQEDSTGTSGPSSTGPAPTPKPVDPDLVKDSPPGGAKGAMWQLVKEDVPDNCKGDIYKPVADECCGDLVNQTLSFNFDNQGQCAVIHLDIRNNGTKVPLFNKKQCDGGIMHYGERCSATDDGKCDCESTGDLETGKCYRGASSQTTDYFLKVDSCAETGDDESAAPRAIPVFASTLLLALMSVRW